MIVHHLNCGSLCPLFERLISGTGSYVKRGHLVCHCLLIETERGLVLVDTGIGQHDIDHPGRFGKAYDLFNKPAYDEQQTALAQIKALGFDPDDVRHIVPTHLDLDHAGGIADFPKATVHVHKTEYETAKGQATADSKRRYRTHQWNDHIAWELYEEAGESWFDFEAVRSLRGLPEEILLVPLAGHTPGQCGVAVQGEGNNWLLHAGDAYFHRSSVATNGKVPLGLKLFEGMAEVVKGLRHTNHDRLRELALKHDNVSVFCAHDPVEFEAFSSGEQPTSSR